jgi:putative flippase GtrA
MSARSIGPLQQGSRFLVVGALNTLLSYALFWWLLQWLDPQPAYAVAYLCGLVFAYLGNSLLVFGAALAWGRLLRYPLVYVGQYLGNASLLALGTGLFGWPPQLALAVAFAFTIPLSFLLNRWVLRG